MEKVLKSGNEIVCPVCNRSFIHPGRRQIYCGEMCAKKAKMKREAETRKLNSKTRGVPICANPLCGKEFVKQHGTQKYCCLECREEFYNPHKNKSKQQKKQKSRTISEVLLKMKEMGYTKSYGKFCVEHPEELLRG